MPTGEPHNLCRLHAHGHGDANLVEDSGGSDEVPLVRNHLCSGESLFLTQKTCVPFRSARKWALAERASSHIYPPCSLFPGLGPLARTENGHFNTNPIPKHSLTLLVADFYLKWSWLFYFAILMEVHLGVVRLVGGGVMHLQFIFPCMITLRVCSVVFD